MKKSTSLGRSGSVRHAILVVSLLTIAAIGILHALPSAAVSADELTPLAERGLVPGTASKSDGAVRVRVSDAYGKLPLHFEVNRGQTDPQVKFLSRSPKHTLFLTSGEAVFVFMELENSGRDGRRALQGSMEKSGEITGTALRMIFVGANPDARMTGRQELPGKANYFIGNDPGKWRTNVPTYARVYYQDLYPNIDLVYYGNHRQLEYDFVVRPGADPSVIALGFRGAHKLEVDAQGDLVLHTASGALRQRKPLIYQEVDGLRREITGGYMLKDSHQVGFQVAAYDRSRPLVIDPVLFYSTYVGGTGQDIGRGGVAVDGAGNAYVTGQTSSANFPTTSGAFDTTFNGGCSPGFSGCPWDAFVTKINPTGSGLVYSTYLGGSGLDAGLGVKVDAAGDAYVTGHTTSTDFPTTPGAYQTTLGGCGGFAGALFCDAFVTKLNPAGTGLVYSTYLGGSSFEQADAIAVDAAGSAYVTGITGSTNFPTTPGAYDTSLGFRDSFVTKLNPAGTGLLYSTYLGGSSEDHGVGIALDTSGNAYVVGVTGSTDFPTTPGAFQTTLSGGGTMTKVNPAGTGLVYSTYLAGSSGSSVAVDAGGHAYVTGQASSTFPTTPGAFQTSFGGGPSDAHVTKLNPVGTGLVYATFLGGSGDDVGSGITVDSLGNAYVTGTTGSSNFPTDPGAFQPTFGGGGQDAFVTKLNPLGTGLVYSSYLGGSSDDAGAGIAIDALPNPNAYVTGITFSTDFPTTPGAFDTTYNGGGDAFVAKITDVVVEPPPTEGKVTGGGSIDVAGGKGSFGFIVQRKETGGPVKGQLQYVNHASGDKVHSVAFDSLVITGNMATFGGACTINNVTPCTFRVDVTDNGEPGTTDSFVVSVTPGSTEGGMLRSGNIQIHK